MATSLDILENKIQIHHLHVKHFHMVKKIVRNGPVFPDIFDEIRQFLVAKAHIEVIVLRGIIKKEKKKKKEIN